MMTSQRREPAEVPGNSSKVAKIDDGLSNWLKAMADYIEETQAAVLDLSRRELGKEEVKLILNVLADSKVTELNLAGNCLHNSMTDLAPLFTRTKVQKLNISDCKLTMDDIFRLVEVLKDTQITDLTLSNYLESCSFTEDEEGAFISNLLRSKLTTLSSINFFKLLPQSTITSFVQDFWNTSITSLDLSHCELSSSDLICLFSNLGRSSVTDLNLLLLRQTDGSSGIFFEVLQELSWRLVETKIEKLSLRMVGLHDDKLSSLVQGLIGSKVTDLNLSFNLFTCVDPLLSKLQETQIRTLDLSWNDRLNNTTFKYADSFRCSSLASLDLSGCGLSDEQGEALMESLRHSNVTKLKVRLNRFGLLTVEKLAKNISDINLVDLDISKNRLTREGVFILGRCFKESKLTRINVSDNRCAELNSSDLISFLKLTEGSSVSQIEMNGFSFDSPLDCELNTLANLPLTELHLAGCSIGAGVLSSVISCVKTTVTHLNLSGNRFGDDGAAVLAECLKGTQIRRLNLQQSAITNEGAKALALSLKETNILYLNLIHNKIEDDGVEFLAEHAKDSFITELNVLGNGFSLIKRISRKSILLIDKVLWDNKITVHKLVTFFRQIAPKANNDEFCFDPNSDDVDVSTFLEKCMSFYKTIINNPNAIGVLLEEKIVPLSREQIFKLVFEEFPRQFSRFVACSIDADVKAHVGILERAEAMGLSAIVEALLLNRPVYMLDAEQGILHPSVYKLLLKYKQPVCNLDVEPRGLIKIIQYFTEHADLEGAQDLINLLQGTTASSSKSID